MMQTAWQEAFDEGGNVYYYNWESSTSQWEYPAEGAYPANVDMSQYFPGAYMDGPGMDGAQYGQQGMGGFHQGYPAHSEVPHQDMAPPYTSGDMSHVHNAPSDIALDALMDSENKSVLNEHHHGPNHGHQYPPEQESVS